METNNKQPKDKLSKQEVKTIIADREKVIKEGTIITK
jgi:hypothetical protein